MSTLKKTVKISGHGIHSGAPVNMVVRPYDKYGVYFKRTDIENSVPVCATYDNVGETKMRNTTIGDISGAHVQTVVRRPVVAYAAEIRRNMNVFSRIKWWFINTVSGRKSNGYVKLEPNDGKSLDIIATLIYPEKIIGAQTYSYSFNGTKKSISVFESDIARARTFGKYSEWEYLKKHGMARGANENNVIALNNAGDGTLNKTIWPDEFVRHKIIDAIGDMYTSGGFVVGKLTSFKGSHALNNLVLKKLFSDSANYDIIE